MLLLLLVRMVVLVVRWLLLVAVWQRLGLSLLLAVLRVLRMVERVAVPILE